VKQGPHVTRKNVNDLNYEETDVPKWLSPSKACTIWNNLKRNSRLSWSLGLIDKKTGHSEQTNDERRQNLSRGPGVTATTEGKTNDGESCTGNDDQISADPDCQFEKVGSERRFTSSRRA